MELGPHSARQSQINTERGPLRSVGAISITNLILINLVNLLVLGLIIIA